MEYCRIGIYSLYSIGSGPQLAEDANNALG